MSSSPLNRRRFHQLGMTAFGGLLAGALSGCPQAKEGSDIAPVPDSPVTPSTPESPSTPDGDAVSLLMQEKHVCRGLNMCKGQGQGKENACAGQGTCATVAAHECAQQNECKGQGGCGSKPGENACKGMGGCHVPLMDHAWGTARKNFEAAMKAAGKEVGAAPEKS